MLREARHRHAPAYVRTSLYCPKVHRRRGPAGGGLHTPSAIMTARSAQLEATMSKSDQTRGWIRGKTTLSKTVFVLIFFWLEAGLIEPIGVGPEPDPLGGKQPPSL